jgi:hypothetical protein
MSVDGTDLTKITGDGMKVIAEAAIAAAAPAALKQGGWFLSRVAAAVLAVVLPLLGGVVGFMTGRATTAPAAVETLAGSGVGSGSGSAATPAPAASGSAAAPEVRTVPYDAKSIAAEAIVGPLAPADGTGDITHPAHPSFGPDNDQGGELLDTGGN